MTWQQNDSFIASFPTGEVRFSKGSNGLYGVSLPVSLCPMFTYAAIHNGKNRILLLLPLKTTVMIIY